LICARGPFRISSAKATDTSAAKMVRIKKWLVKTSFPPRCRMHRA
jgi:hypothetical protein